MVIFDLFSRSIKEDFDQCRPTFLYLSGNEVETIVFNDRLQAINDTLEDSVKTHSSFGIHISSDSDTIEEIFDEAEYDPQA